MLVSRGTFKNLRPRDYIEWIPGPEYLLFHPRPAPGMKVLSNMLLVYV